jgi:hypothetical protein
LFRCSWEAARLEDCTEGEEYDFHVQSQSLRAWFAAGDLSGKYHKGHNCGNLNNTAHGGSKQSGDCTKVPNECKDLQGVIPDEVPAKPLLECKNCECNKEAVGAIISPHELDGDKQSVLMG